MIRVGDIVTRTGSDRHVVEWINDLGDMIRVRCVVPPDDGYCCIGDTENNLTRRYAKVAE